MQRTIVMEMLVPNQNIFLHIQNVYEINDSLIVVAKLAKKANEAPLTAFRRASITAISNHDISKKPLIFYAITDDKHTERFTRQKDVVHLVAKLNDIPELNTAPGAVLLPCTHQQSILNFYPRVSDTRVSIPDAYKSRLVK